MNVVEVVGWLAAVFSALIGVPQAVRLARTRSIEGLSMVAWQTVLGVNLAWTSHGILIGKLNMVLPNSLAMTSTLPVLYLLARGLGRSFWVTLVPSILLAAVMIAIDLKFGSAAFGTFALLPALVANGGQSIELVRARQVTGVSPVFLVAQLLTQGLWFAWGLMVADGGTAITAGTTLLISAFNLCWWIMRSLGLRAFPPKEYPGACSEPESVLGSAEPG